jgi:hypothetical protein
MPYGYSPVTHHPWGSERVGNPRKPKAKEPITIENEDFHVLLYRARCGDKEARAELAARGQRTTRKAG